MKINSKNIVLIEDHDEALKVWEENKIKNLDLVHIDAHMDFGVHRARPIEETVNKARSLKELKRGLEYSLAFRRYEYNFAKQTNIGNYIYPAMEKGIIRDFYWVIPGRLREFKQSLKFIRGMLKSFLRQGTCQSCYRIKDGIISTQFLGRKFIACILEKLPILKQRVLLDIDTDFLIVDSLINSNNTAKISKRKPWILPEDLVKVLKKRTNKPQVITIAYSVNGGYTPIRYKHWGDEIAFLFAPKDFKRRFENSFKAAQYFNLFCSSSKKEYYQKAVKLNPTYRVADNNYGPLYLNIRKFAKAEKEFFKVAKADPKNPAVLLGLGNISLARRDFKKAKKHFSVSLKGENSRLFERVKSQSLLNLAQTEFRLKNFKKAKELFFHYQKDKPLEPQGRYFLGRIYEKEKNFEDAVAQYQDAISLGLNNIEIISRLLETACHLKTRHGIIKFIIAKYKEFKREFLRMKRLNLKKSKKIKGLQKIEEKMLVVEKS